MLFHNDVVTDGEPKPSSFSGRLRCEERIENLFFYFRRNARAVVPNLDLNTVPKDSCRSHKGWLITIAIGLGFALCCRIKAVRDQVQKHPRDILRKYVGLASSWIKRLLQSNVEALLFGTRAVISEVEAFLDQGINIDEPVLARTFA